MSWMPIRSVSRFLKRRSASSSDSKPSQASRSAASCVRSSDFDLKRTDRSFRRNVSRSSGCCSRKPERYRLLPKSRTRDSMTFGFSNRRA